LVRSSCVQEAKGTSNTPLGRCLDNSIMTHSLSLSIDGALDPWMAQLRETLLDIYPLSPGLEVLEETGTPPPRVQMKKASAPISIMDHHPPGHIATVRCNQRITAQDWYQDVRHIEFSFNEELTYTSPPSISFTSSRIDSYEPGDVAVIYPKLSEIEIDSFLISMGWANIADEPYNIIHALKGDKIVRIVWCSHPEQIRHYQTTSPKQQPSATFSPAT
jgi:sulfite reductase alpha subunit-like flavoprotein